MIDSELLQAVRNRNLILFVGAGVSMSLGLPSWSSLVGDMGRELGFDPEIFGAHGDAMALADYYRLEMKGLQSLCQRIDREWHGPEIDISQSVIHRHIVDLNPPLIYTTNYDRWLERAFEQRGKVCRKLFCVRDFACQCDGTQIIKFHGDLDDPNSLVLDETSYFQRMDFESPLDLRLRSDVLGRSVLFIGYSLTDFNIRLLFWKLSQFWSKEGVADQQPPSFFFSAKPNPIQKSVLAKRGIRMMNSEIENPKQALEQFLAELAAELDV